MNQVARAFDEQTNVNVLHSIEGSPKQQEEDQLPWATLTHGAMPPMMFQLRYSNGKMASYAYGDLHEVHFRDAGHVELYLYSLSKLIVTIEGRHLRDLAQWLGTAGIRWIQEADPRDREKPESEPEIVKITVQEIAD